MTGQQATDPKPDEPEKYEDLSPARLMQPLVPSGNRRRNDVPLLALTPSMNPVRIVIFAKAPVPGQVKTRLIPALGDVGAARLVARKLDLALRQALAADVGPVELCMSRGPGGRCLGGGASPGGDRNPWQVRLPYPSIPRSDLIFRPISTRQPRFQG
jgi:hypothetical protein